MENHSFQIYIPTEYSMIGIGEASIFYGKTVLRLYGKNSLRLGNKLTNRISFGRELFLIFGHHISLIQDRIMV